MPYIGKSPTGSGVRTRYYFTATGGETSLSGADDGGKTLTFSDGEYVDVYLNGIALVAGTDYGTATANTISGLAALSGGDIVEVVVYDIFNVAKINSEAVRTRHYYTATGGETSIGTAQIPGLSFPGGTEIEVSLNGISLVQGTDYNTTAANTIGGLSALSAGNVVAVVLYDKFQLADTVSKAQGGTFSGPVTASGGLNVGTIKEATGTTTAMTIDSSGRILMPQRPLFKAGKTSTQTAASAGTYEPIDWNVEVFDVGSNWDNTEFTAPVAGLYYFFFTILTPNDTNEHNFQIRQDSGSGMSPQLYARNSTGNSPNAHETVSGSTILNLSVGHKVDFAFDRNIYGDGSTYWSSCGGYLLG